MQGWREEMEDAHVALPDFDPEREISLFGVFDGHGGRVSQGFPQQVGGKRSLADTLERYMQERKQQLASKCQVGQWPCLSANACRTHFVRWKNTVQGSTRKGSKKDRLSKPRFVSKDWTIWASNKPVTFSIGV